MTLTKCHQCHVNGPWRDGVCLDCLMNDEADELLPHPPPPVATSALPGTDAKIAALTARYEAGYSLWHPADATITDAVTVAIPSSIARLRVAPPPRVRRLSLVDREDAA